MKGKTPEGTLFKHVIGKEDKGTKPIFDWVADGKRAMMFTIEARLFLSFLDANPIPDLAP